MVRGVVVLTRVVLVAVVEVLALPKMVLAPARKILIVASTSWGRRRMVSDGARRDSVLACTVLVRPYMDSALALGVLALARRDSVLTLRELALAWRDLVLTRVGLVVPLEDLAAAWECGVRT